MIISTYSTAFKITNPGGNVGVTTFVARKPQIAVPSGDGIIEFGGLIGGEAAKTLLLVPYGVGLDAQTFNMNVWGWAPTTPFNSGTSLWVPVLLTGFTGCTLDSSATGIAGQDLGAAQYFCRAMTLSVGAPSSGSDVAFVSAGAGNISHVRVEVKGFRFVEVGFSTGGSVTNANALFTKI